LTILTMIACLTRTATTMYPPHSSRFSILITIRDKQLQKVVLKTETLIPLTQLISFQILALKIGTDDDCSLYTNREAHCDQRPPNQLICDAVVV
jgi:hypothetical protein